MRYNIKREIKACIHNSKRISTVLVILVLISTIGYAQDPRVPAANNSLAAELAPAVGRIINSNGELECTAWIAQGGILLTAGHCPVVGRTLEFDVPNSGTCGELNFSDPENQYEIKSVVESHNGAHGNDWKIFDVYDNPITGYQPIQAQLKYIHFAKPNVSSTSIPTIRIIGSGRDVSPIGQGCSSGAGNFRYGTLQTNAGSNATSSSTSATLNIEFDIFANDGDSGAPLINESTGEAIAIYNGKGDYVKGTTLHRSGLDNEFNPVEFNLKVTQKYESGSLLTGSNISRWDVTDEEFDDFTLTGASVDFDMNYVGNAETFRGDQGVLNNPKEKFNEWTGFDDVRNHKVFQLQNQLYTSQFQKTYSGIILKNYYPEYPAFAAGGQLAFKDPWLIDYVDSTFNNETRNQGKDAVFIDQNSPFSPGYSAINGKLYNGLFLNENENFLPNLNNYSVRHDDSPTTESFGGSLGNRQVVFYEWDGTSANFEDPNEEETGVVFTSSSAEARANLKIVGASNENDAYTNNSQRRFIQTKSGSTVWLHKVYSSLGHIWIEHSSNGGSSWTIGNDGEPLDQGAGGKNPSIDYGIDSGNNLNYIGVVWQEPDGANYNIVGRTFTQSSSSSSMPTGETNVTLYEEQSDSYSIDANPNIVLTSGTQKNYILTFERKSSSPGVYWRAGKLELGIGILRWLFHEHNTGGLIPGTSNSTINTQMSLFPGGVGDINLNFLHQEGTGSTAKIRSQYLVFDYNSGSDSWSFNSTQSDDDGQVSYSGYSWSPSLVTLQNGAYSACWQELYDMVFYYFGTSTRYYYGYNIASCSVNRGKGSTFGNFGYAVWSQVSGSSWTNKSILFVNGVPESIPPQTLSSNGKYIQLGNGVINNSMGSMYASTFKPTGTPYTFKTSGSMGPVLVKATTAPTYVEGRGFIIENGEASFNYRFGNLNVDGQDIRFVEAPDSLDYGNLETLNSVLITEPFQITPESEIIFSERPGFADSAAAKNTLKSGDYIRYKIVLVDETTGETVGVIKNVNVNASNTKNLKSKAFSVNAKKFEGGTVRARIELKTNLIKQISNQENQGRIKRSSNLLLTKRYAESNEALNKTSYERIDIEAPDQPATFSLSQNYPNPFNPTTQIEYQIPNAGLVQLEVFDILGRKVQTLVNKTQEVGTYTVTFDASALASGVYLYRLTSGSFTASKKLYLIK